MKKILILAANPKSDLRLDREIKDLKDTIKRNNKFDVEIELAVDAESIDNLILENQPLIVHFCGHGAGERGLVFVDNEGLEQSLPNKVLASLFSSYGEGIECVLLNACYTEVQADAISEHVPYVIGTSREILDEVAHYFSIGFYKGVAEEQPIETCYEWGYVSIKSNLENAEIVASIDEINSKSRKLEFIDDRTIASKVETLEIILKHNKRLESQFASNVSPQLEQEFIEEGRRKRYKDNLRNILDNFGQRIIHREKQISEFELKQRRTLIDKVQEFWIEGFLKPSLYFNTATDADKDHPSGQILRPLDNLEVIPFDIEQSYDSVKNSDIPNQISDGQTLLILGEPGSGKTIALLQLAERLVTESRENSKKPIPVVFNLSSWAENQLSLEEWLIEELKDKYQVPKALSKPWIENQELTLLLDGLDEVKANHRNACVKAIREFSSTHQATEMFVCSRIKDYEALAERLLLSSVICIQPLSRKQLLDFLRNSDNSLSGLKTVIEQDAGIFQFATTPLILNMMTWTYHGWSTKQCYEQFKISKDRKFNLFKAYIKKNLTREDIDKKFPRNKTISWLSYLSKNMIHDSKIVFLIEQLQPSWILNKSVITKYFFVVSVSIGLIHGIISTIADQFIFNDQTLKEDLLWFSIVSVYTSIASFSVRSNMRDKSFVRLKLAVKYASYIFLLCTISIFLFYTYIDKDTEFIVAIEESLYEGSLMGITTGIIIYFGNYLTDKIKLPASIDWSWKLALRNGSITVIIFGFVGSMIIFLLNCIDRYCMDKETFLFVFKWAIRFGLISSCLGFFIGGLAEKNIGSKNHPNYGVKKSLINSVVIGSILGSITGVIYSLVIDLNDGLSNGIIVCLLGGIFFGGGMGCVQHLILRIVLYQRGQIPWNYARFLDFATELRLMKKVGGGYIFYHRMLMEHFANMEQEK